MSPLIDPLATMTARLAEPGLSIGHRIIAEGDEGALLAGEAQLFQQASLQAKRQSGAARLVARRLLAGYGHDGAAIGKAASGAPLWPAGMVGSLAHDSGVAVAAVARSQDFTGVGIDIEPAENLPGEMVDLVATPAERSRYAPSVLHSRVLFVAKEAVYKAIHPLDGVFLDFHDIEIDLDRQVAIVRGARTVSVRVGVSSHVVALAFVRARGA